MFENIIATKKDPILSLNVEFINDPRPNKVNLGIGVYKDNNNQTPIMKVVKIAEQRLVNEETTKNYLGSEGVVSYTQLMQPIIFGADHPVLKNNRITTFQTVAGSCALRIGAEFLKYSAKVKNIWISSPSYINHFSVFEHVGLNINQYSYYDTETNSIDWDNLVADLSKAEPGDAILLQACCHNPTGVDFSKEQLQKLVELTVQLDLIPFFDMAYQGLGDGMEEDAYAVRLFAEKHTEMLLASSCSKNIGLYRERVGALSIIVKNSETIPAIKTQLIALTRYMYSTPSGHGAQIVAIILEDPELKQLWLDEVKEMRERIQAIRKRFVQLLKDKGVKRDFSFIAQQKGMFSYSNISVADIVRLREEFAVYMLENGRINMAGLTDSNIEYTCDSIARVLAE